MKKMIAAFLLFSMVLPVLSGCTPKDSIINPITFYYQNQSFDYEADCSALGSEIRDGGLYPTLEETLTAYLAGPQSETLLSPFPAELSIIALQWEETRLCITLSDHIGELKGISLTIACCCLAKTCLELTDATEISIQAETILLGGQQSIIISHENMDLLDETQQPNND